MMHVGDTMSASGNVQYIGGCSVHQGYHENIGNIISTSGDIMSTSRDVQYIGVFNRN